MYLVRATFHAAGPPTDADLLIRLFRDSVGSGDGVEHVYAQRHSESADVVFFVIRPSPELAEVTVADLCQRCIVSHPELRGWTLIRCGIGRSFAAPKTSGL